MLDFPSNANHLLDFAEIIYETSQKIKVESSYLLVEFSQPGGIRPDFTQNPAKPGPPNDPESVGNYKNLENFCFPSVSKSNLNNHRPYHSYFITQS